MRRCGCSPPCGPATPCSLCGSIGDRPFMMDALALQWAASLHAGASGRRHLPFMINALGLPPPQLLTQFPGSCDSASAFGEPGLHAANITSHGRRRREYRRRGGRSPPTRGSRTGRAIATTYSGRWRCTVQRATRPRRGSPCSSRSCRRALAGRRTARALRGSRLWQTSQPAPTAPLRGPRQRWTKRRPAATTRRTANRRTRHCVPSPSPRAQRRRRLRPPRRLHGSSAPLGGDRGCCIHEVLVPHVLGAGKEGARPPRQRFHERSHQGARMRDSRGG